MDVTLVEHAKQDIDRGDGRGDQNRLVRERLLEYLRGAGEIAVDRGRHADFVDGVGDLARRRAERGAGVQIKRDGRGDEQALMAETQSPVRQHQVITLETPRYDPRTRALIEVPIAATLIRLAAPNVLVMLAQTSVGLVETYFVGKLGTDALAGVAL